MEERFASDIDKIAESMFRRLALDILRHPFKFLALVAVIAILGWLSGYDVR